MDLYIKGGKLQNFSKKLKKLLQKFFLCSIQVLILRIMRA